MGACGGFVGSCHGVVLWFLMVEACPLRVWRWEVPHVLCRLEVDV